MANTENQTTSGGPGERSRLIFFAKITFAVVALLVVFVFTWLSIYGRDSEGRSKDTQEFLAQYDDLVIPSEAELDRGALFAEASYLANDADPQFCVDALEPLEDKTFAELTLYYECSVTAGSVTPAIESEYFNALSVEGDFATLFAAAQSIEERDPSRAKQLYQEVIDSAPEPIDEEVEFILSESQKKVGEL